MTTEHKLVGPTGTDEGALYDRDRDPPESSNRLSDPDYAEVPQRLLTRLADRMAETVDPQPGRKDNW